MQPRHVLNLFQNTVFSCLPNYVFYLFLIWSYPFLDWFHLFVHFLILLNLNLNLAFSTSFKNTSCEHLGNPMRSSITQYLHIFDMWWNLSCLLARRVLSHKAKQNWSHHFWLIHTFENLVRLFTPLTHIWTNLNLNSNIPMAPERGVTAR